MFHVWSILCRKTSVDKDTNNLSLFDTIEQINITAPSPPDDGTLLPLEMVLVSLCERLDISKSTKGYMQIRIIDPNRNEIGSETILVDLTEHQRMRTFSRLAGLVYKGTGRYNFEVSLQQTQDGPWEKVATLPLTIDFEASDEG